MDYQLAKELKEAGFPQNGADCNWLRVLEDYPNGDDEVYAPTLSELIEACGPMFYALRHGQQAHKWTADARYPFPTKNGNHLKRRTKSRTGNTPEEAVARLYLAIHTPKIKQP